MQVMDWPTIMMLVSVRDSLGSVILEVGSVRFCFELVIDFHYKVIDVIGI